MIPMGWYCRDTCVNKTGISIICRQMYDLIESIKQPVRQPFNNRAFTVLSGQSFEIRCSGKITFVITVVSPKKSQTTRQYIIDMIHDITIAVRLTDVSITPYAAYSLSLRIEYAGLCEDLPRADQA